MISAKRESVYMLLRTKIPLLLLLIVSCSAFCTIPSSPLLLDSVVGRNSAQTTTPRAVVSSLFMAMPGMSEEQRKAERDNEIRQKIAQLKSQGRMTITNKDGIKESAEDSAMAEAEAFFNKPSPFKKFELRRKAEREKEALLLKEKEEEKAENEKE
jgi:hypothetical protein